MAVVIGADDLSERQMAEFAKWTNLSETTFLLAPTMSEADYRVALPRQNCSPQMSCCVTGVRTH